MFRSCLLFLLALNAMIASSKVHAQTICTDPNITFTKIANTASAIAANQDHTTDNVWITRSGSNGIYNTATEGLHSSFAGPLDTELVFPFDNPIALIADLTAMNRAALTLEDWETAIESSIGGGPRSILDQPVALHLIGDNIYLNVRCLPPWGGMGDGKSTYERSKAVPGFASLGFDWSGLVISTVFRSRPKRS